MLRRTAAFLDAASSAGLPAGNPVRKSWYRNNLMIKRQGSLFSRWGSGAEGVNAGQPLVNQVKVHCVDNTNCKHVRLISVAASERAAHCRIFPGVAHRVSVLRFKSGRGATGRQRVKPGTIFWVCLFTRRQYNTRHSGLITNFDRTTGVIMNDQHVPLGTRVMYCAGRHVNHKVHLKAAVMANFFV